MNSSLKNKESIREYLLGRVNEDSVLSEVEELLFMDEEFCTEVEIAEDQLINDYVFCRLASDDMSAFEKTLINNPERTLSVQLATALKEKARTVTAPSPQTVGFFDSLAAFFKQPRYGAGFAVALIGIVIFSYVILSRRTTNELANLQAIYKQRQTETRISGFDYAPMAIVRGDDKKEDDQRKLRGIELALIKANEQSPDARTHHDLGVFYLNERDLPKAIKELELAVKADGNNAKFHNDLGSAYFELTKSGGPDKKFENIARAIEEFSRALEINPDLLEALFNRSLALQESALPRQAKESWDQYLQKDPSSKWADEARKNLEKLVNQQTSLKTNEKVLEDFLIAYRNKDEALAWKINSQTRDVYFGMWLPDQLSRRYARAKLKGDAAEENESIDALTYIGSLEKEKNADFFVSDVAGQISEAAKNEVKKLIEAQEFFDLGLAKSTSTTYPLALQSFEKSGQLFLQAGFPIGEKMSQYWVMQILKSLARNKEAVQKSEEVLQFARKNNYKWFEASILYYTGNIYLLRKELSKSMDSYLASFERSKILGDTLLQQRSGMTILMGLIETGEYRKALGFRFEPAADLYYTGSLLPQWRNTYYTATLLLKLKLPKAAGSFAFESLAIAQDPEKPIGDNAILSLVLLAEVMTASGKLDGALDFATRSLDLIRPQTDDDFKRSREADVTLRIANLKSNLGRCDEAVGDFDRAISLFELVPEFKVDEYAAHKGLLMCYKHLGRSADVTRELETVLSLADSYRHEIMSDESRQSFFDNEQAVFDVAIEDSLARRDGAEAFRRAERSKARSLLDIMSSERSIESLQKEFYQVAEPMSLETIRAEMPANSQVIEYALLEDRLVVWTISKDSLQTIDSKVDGAGLKKSIQELAGVERNRNSKTTDRAAAASALYRSLIEPVSGFLDPAKTLVIVPDKSLYFVPFASLIDGDGRFLIQQFAISYSPSATIFVSASKKGASFDGRIPGRLLAIGDPAFDRAEYPGLPSLDAARTEARKIASMSEDSLVMTGEDATKENFLKSISDAGTVHFAGHYLPDPEVPAHSKLILARSGGDLQMSEIAGKKFANLNLVVLSACETGIEDVLEGEGLISASRAFLAAGVPVVVASQWKVDSDATEKLMVAFHRNRLQNGINSADALRLAQLEMIEDTSGPYASPYFWAAFSVIGGLES